MQKKTFKMKIRMEKGSKNGAKERVQGQDVLAGLYLVSSWLWTFRRSF